MQLVWERGSEWCTWVAVHGKEGDVSLVPPCAGVFPLDLEILCSPLHLVKQTVFQVGKTRVSMIFYSPTIIQANPRYKLDLPELEPIFCITISHLLGPCWATAPGPASLSQLLRLLLWLQTISALLWTSLWWSGFWSSSCLCSAHSAWPRAPGSYPCSSHHLLLALLPWTWTILLLSGCYPHFCPFGSLMTNTNVENIPATCRAYSAETWSVAQSHTVWHKHRGGDTEEPVIVWCISSLGSP